MEKDAKVTKSCPKCGEPLVIRTNRQTGQEFLGCSQYPRCTHTEELPEYFQLKRAGAPTLF